MKKTFGRIAVASTMLLGLGVGVASAAVVDLQPNAGLTAKKFAPGVYTATAKKNAAITQAASPTFTFTVQGSPSTIALNTGDVLTFTVGGGAAFVPSSWTTQLSNVLGGGTNTTTAIAAGDCKLSSGNAVFTCTMTSATKATNYGNLTLTNVKYDLSAANADVTVTVSHQTTTFGATSTAADSTSKSGRKAADYTIFTAGAGVLSGGKLNSTLGSNSKRTIGVASAFKTVGTVNALTSTAASAPFAIASNLGSAVTATGNIVFTIAGLPAAATKITFNGVSLSASDAAGTAKSGAGVGGSFWFDGAGNAYAKVAANAVSSVLAASKVFTIEFDGTTVMSNTTITLAIDYKAGASDNFVSHSILAASTIGTLSRDGSTFRLNRLVSGSSLRLTNLDSGTAGGAITITAYDSAGKTLPNAGTVALPTTVAPGGNSVDILGSDLITDFGSTIDHITVTVEAQSVEGSLTHAITGLGFSTTVATTSSSATTVDL